MQTEILLFDIVGPHRLWFDNFTWFNPNSVSMNEKYEVLRMLDT